MDIFLPKDFSRQAKRLGIDDEALGEAIERAENGLIDANLGGGLVKQRIARPGAGRSKGARSIIYYRHGSRAVFLHLFAKNDKANIAAADLTALKNFAATLDRLAWDEIDNRMEAMAWRKLNL